MKNIFIFYKIDCFTIDQQIVFYLDFYFSRLFSGFIIITTVVTLVFDSFDVNDKIL